MRRCNGANCGPGKIKKFRFKNKLLSLDSSTISLCLSLFPWAKFRRTKGAVKLTCYWITMGICPVLPAASTAKRTKCITPGSFL